MKTVSRILFVLLALSLLVPAFNSIAEAGSQGKKVLMIVAKDDFEQTEYGKTRSKLEDGGVVCTVASTKVGKLKGNKGKRIACDMLLADVNVADYDAIVIIGGNGIKKVWKNDDAHRIVKEAVAQDKIVAAICAGPGILAYSGVLDGKKATAHPKSGAQSVMKSNGCEYLNEKVVVDGKMITANGPQAASAYGEAIVKALN